MSLSRIKDKDDQDGHSQLRRERVGSGWNHHAVQEAEAIPTGEQKAGQERLWWCCRRD